MKHWEFHEWLVMVALVGGMLTACIMGIGKTINEHAAITAEASRCPSIEQAGSRESGWQSRHLHHKGLI